jgi:hypothetical protein
MWAFVWFACLRPPTMTADGSSSVDHTYALLPNLLHKKRRIPASNQCKDMRRLHKKTCTETKSNLGCACVFFLNVFTILYARFRFTESKNLKKFFVHLDVRFHFLQTEHQTRPGTHTHTHFILVQTGRNMCHRNLTQKLNQTKPQKTTVCQPDVQLTKRWASARFKTSRSLTSANVSTTTATIRFNTLANHRVEQVNTANIFSVQNHIHAARKKNIGKQTKHHDKFASHKRWRGHAGHSCNDNTIIVIIIIIVIISITKATV